MNYVFVIFSILVIITILIVEKNNQICGRKIFRLTKSEMFFSNKKLNIDNNLRLTRIKNPFDIRLAKTIIYKLKNFLPSTMKKMDFYLLDNFNIKTSKLVKISLRNLNDFVLYSRYKFICKELSKFCDFQFVVLYNNCYKNIVKQDYGIYINYSFVALSELNTINICNVLTWNKKIERNYEKIQIYDSFAYFNYLLKKNSDNIDISYTIDIGAKSRVFQFVAKEKCRMTFELDTISYISKVKQNVYKITNSEKECYIATNAKSLTRNGYSVFFNIEMNKGFFYFIISEQLNCTKYFDIKDILLVAKNNFFKLFPIKLCSGTDYDYVVNEILPNMIWKKFLNICDYNVVLTVIFGINEKFLSSKAIHNKLLSVKYCEQNYNYLLNQIVGVRIVGENVKIINKPKLNCDFCIDVLCKQKQLSLQYKYTKLNNLAIEFNGINYYNLGTFSTDYLKEGLVIKY